MDIYRIRKELNYTQEQFGKLLGYKSPQVRVSELERGVRCPGPAVRILLKKLERLAQLIKENNCAARCPECGWWTTTGKTIEDGLKTEMICNECGHRWFAII